MLSAADIFMGIVEAVVANRNNFRRNKHHIVDDLRLLRFDDDGIKSLLQRVAAGESYSEAMAKERLINFNDVEWRVKDAAERLLEEVGSVSRLTREELGQIRRRKLDVRSEVQNLVNTFGQAGAVDDRKMAAKLLIEIGKLNQAIDVAEHLLLHGN